MISNYNKTKKLNTLISLFLLLFFSNSLAMDNSNISLEELYNAITHPSYSLQEILHMAFSSKSVSQYALHKKILNYLESGLSNIPEAAKEYIITNLRRGYCGGYSSLWAYSKWLQFKNPSSNDKYGPIKRMEDKDWMTSNILLIAELDKKTPNEEEIASLDDFITTLDYFQSPTRLSLSDAPQGELNQSLHDTNKGSPNKEYSISALLTLKQLKQLLNTKNLVQDNKLVLISSHNHATALFKNEKNYYYFDPNNPEGEVTTQSIDYVAEYIFYALFGPSWLNTNNIPSPIAIRIFSFDENSFPYPPVKEVLENINPVLFTKKNFEYEGINNNSALRFAVGNNDTKSIQYYLEKHHTQDIPINIPGKLTLHYIYRLYNYYNIDIGWLLNEPNVDPKILMSAIAEKRQDTINLLLAHPKININAVDEYGRTALMNAVISMEYDIVELLLSKEQTDPNTIDIYGKTPLMIAADRGNSHLIQILLSNKKTNPNITDKDGNTAAMLSQKNGYCELFLFLADPRTDLNKKNKDGNSMLAIAVSSNNYETAKLLLSKEQIDPNTIDAHGKTPLMNAVKHHENSKFIELLLSNKKTDPNIADKDGNTAFMLVVLGDCYGSPTIKLKQFLADPRTDLNKKNNAGYSLLNIARTNKIPWSYEITSMIKTEIEKRQQTNVY